MRVAFLPMTGGNWAGVAPRAAPGPPAPRNTELDADARCTVPQAAMPHSAILNVMIKAAYRAGRSLKRDLGEVENLQVSLKGPRNFVTAADRRPRRSCARNSPRRGRITASSARKAARAPAPTRRHRWIVDPLDGTTNFLHGIPHFAVSIALERNGTIVAGADLQSGERRTVRRRARQGRLPQRPAHPRRRTQAPRRSGGRLRPAALSAAATLSWRARKSPPRSSISPGCAGSAPPRSISPGSPPAASTPIGSATCRRGTWPPA